MSQRPDGVDRFLHPTGHVIDGGHVAAANGATLPVEDPSTGEVFSAIPAGDAGDVDAAVRAARASFTVRGDESPSRSSRPCPCRLGTAVIVRAASGT